MSEDKKKGVFRDSEGNPSAMRWMTFIALIVAAFLAIAPVMGWSAKCEVDPMIIFSFLAAAFGGKVGQRFAEKTK